MQIQLDGRTYDKLRRRAIEKGWSISSLARDLLARSLGSGGPRQRFSIKDFTFIGAGRSHQGRLSPVSERHDETLAVRLPERKEGWKLRRPKKKSWSSLFESLDQFTEDFMQGGGNQPHIQKRDRVFS